MQYVSVDIIDQYGGVTLASGVSTTVLGPFNLLRYPRKSVTLYNLGPVTASGLVVQINPDQAGTEGGATIFPATTGAPPNPGLWENYDTTSFQSLPTGTVKTLQITNAVAKFWRVQGLNAALTGQAITVSGWLYGNSI